jgi:hypothetical protein
MSSLDHERKNEGRKQGPDKRKEGGSWRDFL